MWIKHSIPGIISYLPGGKNYLIKRNKKRMEKKGIISARYYYAIWLTYVIKIYQSGILKTTPNVVAELGPGGSLGCGLAALLSGANKYYAFDIVDYASNEDDLDIFEELIILFQNREKIPDKGEFPQIKTDLDSYEFPHFILSDEILEKTLMPKRLNAIKDNLKKLRKNNLSDFITYIVPWNDLKIISESSVDMIFSKSVLEHIDNLEFAYKSIYKWLKQEGITAHEIDFRCHGFSDKWNGHWAYSDIVWQIIKGKRPYLLNREPLITHIDLLKKHKFKNISILTKEDFTGIKRNKLSSRFRYISDQELNTYNAFIISIKETG